MSEHVRWEWKILIYMCIAIKILVHIKSIFNSLSWLSIKQYFKNNDVCVIISTKLIRDKKNKILVMKFVFCQVLVKLFYSVVKCVIFCTNCCTHIIVDTSIMKFIKYMYLVFKLHINSILSNTRSLEVKTRIFAWDEIIPIN